LSRHNEEFKKLQKFWYLTLSHQGFNDIENDKGYLENKHSAFVRTRFVRIKYDTTRDYYILAFRMLNDYTFKNELEKEIWRLHCEGMTERAIATSIKVYKKSMVHYIIAKLAKWIKK